MQLDIQHWSFLTACNKNMAAGLELAFCTGAGFEESRDPGMGVLLSLEGAAAEADCPAAALLAENENDVDNDGPFLKDALAVPATHIKTSLHFTWTDNENTSRGPMISGTLQLHKRQMMALTIEKWAPVVR